MKLKRQNHSILFKSMVMVVALALTVLCFPINQLSAMAASLSQYTDFSYMTIGKLKGEEVQTTVTKGDNYEIHNAFIGGSDDYVVGRPITGNEVTDRATTATIVSSNVTVSYSSVTMDNVDSDKISEVEDMTNKVTVNVDGDAGYSDYYGHFTANKLGTYTITYSYVYTVEDASTSTTRTFRNSYDLKIDSQLSKASINLSSNDENFIPNIIDLSLLKEVKDTQGKVTGYQDAKGNAKNLVIPKAVIKDEDGEELEDIPYTTTKLDRDKCVVVSAVGGINSKNVEIKTDTDGNLYIDGAIFADANYGAGKYTIKYSYFDNGQFVASTTKSTQVYAKDTADKENKHYKDYKLELELSSEWPSNGQTGVESTLPKAKGVTSKDTTPAGEEVDVSYKVKVYYKSTSSSKGYDKTITPEVYGADIVNADGSLVDPTVFKPLHDGYYAFQYIITDFYGNEKASSIGIYEFADIKDEKAPTPIIYDAAVKVEEGEDVKDETYKLASRSVPNGVIVYAIGMDDNVSKATDEKVELVRKIMTSDTVSKLTISNYNQYNLVFNYRKTTANAAYTNLIANNYYIRKATSKLTGDQEINSDAKMLAWLKENKYLIVVDNANYASIYEYFKEESIFGNDIDTADKFLEWMKNATEEETAAIGFAYLNVDQTFGASSDNDGMGTGMTYYIHYIAKDAAGNEKDISRSMYIGSFEDHDKPELKFSTTLSDSYLPSSTITFDVPTASDNYDSNMLVKTMYRFLKKDGTPILGIKDKEDKVLTTENLNSLWEDLDNSTATDQKDLMTKYSAYHEGENDGYIDLTDTSASSYKIDLKTAGSDAVKLQIVTYVYDDNGNANIYGETIGIANTTDNFPPVFEKVETSESEGYKYVYDQGDEIELPSMTVADDAVAFMSAEVNVYYVKDDVKTKVATYDSFAEKDVQSLSGAGTYTIHGGKFVASFAGDYQVSIAVKDSKNKTVVSFVNYKVNEKVIIQTPQVVTSLENKTIELDGDSSYDPNVGIELPTPSVNYEIANSETYEKYKEIEDKNKVITEESNKLKHNKYVILGVNENGKATNYSVSSHSGTQNAFIPDKTGTYSLSYNVKMTVYNQELFEYQEMEFGEDGSLTPGGYFKHKNKNIALVSNENEIFIVTADNYGVSFDYKLVKEGNEVSLYYEDGVNTGKVESLSGVAYSGLTVEDIKSWANEILNYNLQSENYTIVVEDKKGPTLAEYDYVTAISTEELEAGESEITIFGIEAEDKSGINVSKSKVVLSWKLSNGSTGSNTWQGEKAFDNQTYKLQSSNGNVLDGTYTITYTVYDNNNNYTSNSSNAYTIAVGDNIAPTLSFDDEFMEDTYVVGHQLKIETSKIHADDNRPLPEANAPVLTLKNTSTDKEIEMETNNDIYVVDLDEVGSYTLTVEIEDAVGNKTTETFNFEVTAKSTDTVKTYKIIGTILIVVSVLVLVGVIVYFIVSKVKLDKELKK